MLIAEQMTPAAVELTLEIRREIEARHEEADRLRCRSIERAQIEADLAQRRFMLVDPNNRLVAEWNEKLRVLAKAREKSRARTRAIVNRTHPWDSAFADFGRIGRAVETISLRR